MTTRKFAGIMAVMGLFAAMAQPFARTTHRSSGQRYDTKAVKERVRQIALSNGAYEYNFPDGFTCIARNQKNADRKHANWLNAKPS